MGIFCPFADSGSPSSAPNYQTAQTTAQVQNCLIPATSYQK
jgi:hypothetical protein